MGRKYNLQKAKDIFSENKCLLLATEYINCDAKMPYTCSCGDDSNISLYNFRQGKRCKKCGYKKAAEKIGLANTKHGHTKRGILTKDYTTWRSMMQRCYRETHPAYEHYGGRGITVEKQFQDFATFHSYMGEKPEGMTLDRIDNMRGYETGNLRWATMEEQSNNRRTNVTFTLNGETMSANDWEKKIGVAASTIRSRGRKGWDDKECLKTPNKSKGYGWHKKLKKWLAYSLGNPRKHLGYYASEKEAANAVMKSQMKS